MGSDEFVPFLEKLVSGLNGFDLSDGVKSRPWTNSDNQPFMLHGIPTFGLMAHLDEESVKYYHSAGDSFDKVNKKYLSDAAAVVSDPQPTRRLDRLTADDLAALESARCAVQSEAGKQLARARAEKVERSFEQVLDCGGARRTTLRFRQNVRKRYLIQAACANLSLLMRHVIGVGTPKQALASAYASSIAFVALMLSPMLPFGPPRLSHRLVLGPGSLHRRFRSLPSAAVSLACGRT